jgi:hypothetical protein
MLAVRFKPCLDHRGKGKPCRRIQTGSVEILFLSNWNRGCHCCRMMFLPPNIYGPCSSTACIFSSVFNLKIIKPLAMVVTFSRPHCFPTRDGMAFCILERNQPCIESTSQHSPSALLPTPLDGALQVDKEDFQG